MASNPKPRKNKEIVEAPLPTFNLTVLSVSPMPATRDKAETYRSIYLKFNDRKMAEKIIAELQAQLDSSEYTLPGVEVSGRVTP